VVAVVVDDGGDDVVSCDDEGGSDTLFCFCCLLPLACVSFGVSGSARFSARIARAAVLACCLSFAVGCIHAVLDQLHLGC
jgi:hypothetical protein